MENPILQTVELGLHWPTIDPFLFCAHHNDAYPAGNELQGPDESLDGREIGMDFVGADGWRMYHGDVVPGFPQHPHRGFETVTYVRTGYADHSDSLGATARFGQGDVQWLTAGAGIVHAEMFPLRNKTEANPLELFQIWLNLPGADKMVDPYFTMIWANDIPRVRSTDASGRSTEVLVLAGSYGEITPPTPPPNSWAARLVSDVAIWHLHLDAGTSLDLPAAESEDTVRTIYVFDGAGIQIAGVDLPAGTGSVVRSDLAITLESSGGAECLVLQGRPIGEPVARQGPFVMNDEQGLRQTFEDYRRTGFGGWPWPVNGPVHPAESGRFARFPDGHIEHAPG